ncbi:MAG TPA: helix-turn-helix transcriptional regulator [Nocardioidaceae bacterium]|nr:helix-turn-helix transcriptional regulator [Nocardioidaceae bacterium]
MDGSTVRFESWLDIVGDLMSRPVARFPRVTLLRELGATFDCTASWNWTDADGTFGFESLDLPWNWPPPDEFEFWRREAMWLHPLVRWYTITGDPTAMSIRRVPRRLTSQRGYDLVREHLRPVGLDQQMSVPYRMGSGGSHRTFVLARTGDDFSRDDIALARRIQPLLALLARQALTLESSRPPAGAVAASGLTGSELAVLQLLSDGLTATAIGRRLGRSPRTVQKHLEHIYRKLEVTDRLMAVRVAQDQRLVGPCSVRDGSGARPSACRDLVDLG